MRGVAVVTGGSGGIGAATCRCLAAQGWDVLVGYRTDVSSATRVVEECRHLGVRADAQRAEVTCEADVATLFAAASSLGPVGALVAGAGVGAPPSRLEDITYARMLEITSTNVIGVMLCAREAVRAMSPRLGGGGGVIVSVSSGAARRGAPGRYVDYAASKGAVESFTVGLAAEVGADGIRVNAVRPGLIVTAIHAKNGEPGRAEEAGRSVPLGRAGRAEEVAEAITWLCGDQASYVTGAVLDVTGGR